MNNITNKSNNALYFYLEKIVKLSCYTKINQLNFFKLLQSAIKVVCYF